MERLNTIADLKRLHAVLTEQRSSDRKKKVEIRVAMSTCSIANGADKICADILEFLLKAPYSYRLVKTGCMGLCHSEPTVEVITPDGDSRMFGNVSGRTVPEIDLYIKDRIKIN